MSKMAVFRHYRRIWAIGAIRGNADKLVEMHRQLVGKFQPGDRLVYLGGFLGTGPENLRTIEEMLSFRRLVIAQPGMFAADVVFLRGQMEEMWHKLLQLQFAPNPKEILPWMLERGMDAVIAAYGGDIERGLAAARDGALTITRWTSTLRQAMQSHQGHWALLSHLHHAAHTEDNKLLFVHAGIDPKRDLQSQGDIFWWGCDGFERLAEEPFQTYAKVVRGHHTQDMQNFPYGLSIDGGCGLGGNLIALCLDAAGEISDHLEA